MKRIEGITKERLEELYTKQKLSTRQCAKIFECSRGKINNALHKYNISIRHPTALKTNITKEALINLYINKKLSISRCANALDCKQTTIAQKLKVFKIPIRSKSEGCMLRDDARSDITKEKLIDLYLDQEQSSIVCADYFGCNESSIRLKLKKFGIPVRSQSDAIKVSKPFQEHLKQIWDNSRVNIKKEDLKQLYVDQGFSLNMCANMFDTTSMIVSNRLRELGIPVRTLSGARKIAYENGRTERFVIQKEALARLYINKSFSIAMCAEVLGTDHSTIHAKLKKLGIPIRSYAQALQNSYEKKRREILSPNKSELYLFELIEEACPNEYKYVGGGSFWIHGLNPDFIHCNGKKKVIELFGEYWHKEGDNWKRTEFGRMAIFNQLGYDILIIWGKELKDREKVIKKIKEFNSR